MDRKTPFIDIIRGLIPFFVTRQVFAGAGRVGIGAEGRTQGFQLSQRADFFEVEVGLETTLKRPIINTRDEPHADADKYRRLHVIIGDANLAELSTYLKVGTTSLVLAMIEARALPRDLTHRGAGGGAAGDQPRPVADAQGAAAGRPAADRARGAAGCTWSRRRSSSTTQGETDEQTADVLRRWAEVLDDLADRPDALRRPAGLAGEAAAAGGLPVARRARRGATRGCSWSTCSTPTCGRTRGSTTGWWPAGRCSGC